MIRNVSNAFEIIEGLVHDGLLLIGRYVRFGRAHVYLPRAKFIFTALSELSPHEYNNLIS